MSLIHHINRACLLARGDKWSEMVEEFVPKGVESAEIEAFKESTEFYRNAIKEKPSGDYSPIELPVGWHRRWKLTTTQVSQVWRYNSREILRKAVRWGTERIDKAKPGAGHGRYDWWIAGPPPKAAPLAPQVLAAVEGLDLGGLGMVPFTPAANGCLRLADASGLYLPQGEEKVWQVLESHDPQLVTLAGQPGSGKTWMLRFLRTCLESERRPGWLLEASWLLPPPGLPGFEQDDLIRQGYPEAEVLPPERLLTAVRAIAAEHPVVLLDSVDLAADRWSEISPILHNLIADGASVVAASRTPLPEVKDIVDRSFSVGMLGSELIDEGIWRYRRALGLPDMAVERARLSKSNSEWVALCANLPIVAEFLAPGSIMERRRCWWSRRTSDFPDPRYPKRFADLSGAAHALAVGTMIECGADLSRRRADTYLKVFGETTDHLARLLGTGLLVEEPAGRIRFVTRWIYEYTLADALNNADPRAMARLNFARQRGHLTILGDRVLEYLTDIQLATLSRQQSSAHLPSTWPMYLSNTVGRTVGPLTSRRKKRRIAQPM